ncbi:uncharacterized protein LOC111244837 isoform X2 [Varroa destructor]|uniref:Uncharacterized protein n=1 Tax=Varroa destructor TaxID=109461 RepID=A0A7M7J858_VARDE|nr:uncharacterized protein LOC111244837 isoform X2 [Varroa destructor]
MASIDKPPIGWWLLTISALLVKSASGYARPDDDHEDHFAKDVKSYAVPASRLQHNVAPFPASGPPRSSTKPSRYARPEISNDDDWGFYVKADDEGGGGGDHGVAPAIPNERSKPQSRSSGWPSSDSSPASEKHRLDPVGPAANVGWNSASKAVKPSSGSAEWSPFDDSGPTILKRPSPSYGPNSEAAEPQFSTGWQLSSDRAGNGGGWSPLGNASSTLPSKRSGPAYGFFESTKPYNESGSFSKGGSARPSSGSELSFGKGVSEWLPFGDNTPTRPSNRPTTDYDLATASKLANEGWSPLYSQSARPSFGPRPFSDAGGASWSPSGGNEPTRLLNRPSIAYGPAKHSNGDWSLSSGRSTKLIFGPALSNDGRVVAGWSSSTSHRPNKLGAAYGPSNPFKLSNEGWSLSSGQSGKPSFVQGLSFAGSHASWSPSEKNFPTPPPNKASAAYGRAPASKSANGGWLPLSDSAKLNFGLKPASAAGGVLWSPFGRNLRTHPLNRPGATYGPALIASNGGWSPSLGQFVESNFSPGPSPGEHAERWLSSGEVVPTHTPKRPGPAYGLSGKQALANGEGWSPSTGGSNKSNVGLGLSAGAEARKWPPSESSNVTILPKRPKPSYGVATVSASINVRRSTEGWLSSGTSTVGPDPGFSPPGIGNSVRWFPSEGARPTLLPGRLGVVHGPVKPLADG